MATMDQLIDDMLRDRRLLSHPFYRRWEAGALAPSELPAYAAQYRHFEANLPTFLAELADAMGPGAARDQVMANLADELGDPTPHLELFDGFAAAVGAPTDEPATPATQALLDAYRDALTEGPVSALAALSAYEVQASEIAVSKAAGLAAHYGLDGAGLGFWEHHATVDDRHGRWLCDALADLPGAPEALGTAGRRVADAWWSFLDEREAMAPLPV